MDAFRVSAAFAASVSYLQQAARHSGDDPLRSDIEGIIAKLKELDPDKTGTTKPLRREPPKEISNMRPETLATVRLAKQLRREHPELSLRQLGLALAARGHRASTGNEYSSQMTNWLLTRDAQAVVQSM